jgi:hypothetical protein
MIKEKIIFQITKGDVQEEAVEILGRELTEVEILEVKKSLEYGIGETIGIIYESIFKEIKSNFRHV